MPSGSRRQTSSVMPGRMVGLTMPTTPRQLENDIALPPDFLLPFVHLAGRNIAFRHIAGECLSVALGRIAVAAAARALYQEFLARLQLEARRGRRLEFLIGAEARTTKRAGVPASPPASPAGGNLILLKRRMTVASSSSSYSRRSARPPRHCPAPPESGTTSKRVMRQGYSDSRISIGVVCRLLRCVAVAVVPSWPAPPP